MRPFKKKYALFPESAMHRNIPLTICANNILGVDNFRLFRISGRIQTFERNLSYPQYADSVLAERTDPDRVRLIICKFNGAWLDRSVYSQTMQHHGVYEYAFNNSLVQSNLNP